MAVVVVTGGGAQALSWLLASPGASRTILESTVPYSKTALAEFLGYEPTEAASADVAADMARMAFERARHLASAGDPVVGVGCTAALATDRVKKGKHRCFVAQWSKAASAAYEITFQKGLRDRAAEDDIASRLVLRALADAGGLDFDLPLGLVEDEHLDVLQSDDSDFIDQLLAGQVRSVTVYAGGLEVADEPVTGGVLSGSFDPLHRGHEELAKVAASLLGSETTFELSVSNVDKPPLPADEVRRRLSQFAGKDRVVVTSATTFEDKAAVLPGCTFVIGFDTAVRLFDTRYYDRDEARMAEALSNMRSHGCRFLVAGRFERGVYYTLADVPVPAEFRDMLSEIPEAKFRIDVSSTELREDSH